MGNSLKIALQGLSQALQELHRTLLLTEAQRLSNESGAPVNPYDLLQASLHDPSFAWLRQMSMLIVHIDMVVDETENLSGTEANQIHELVLRLIEKPDEGKDQEFWSKYSAYLNDPEIIMMHSKVKTILGSLAPSQ